MRNRTVVPGILAVVFAASLAHSTAAPPPTTVSEGVPITALWEQPTDLPARDLFNGPWGPTYAPDPTAVYTYVRPKKTGTNPGLVVQDPLGRTWHVKQPPHNDNGAEGPVEVAVSRLLSAVGYHQPPVYFLPSFTMRDASGGTHREPGGRFRLQDGTLKSQGEWSWQQNPFVGTRPHQGLLTILLMVNSFDLRDTNNTLYEVRGPDNRVERWYVVRDLGGALGESARLGPTRNDPDVFERQTFISGVRNGFVRFSYHGWNSEILRDRITPEDVAWAAALLSGLSDRQWHDAFRAGGYTPAVAERYIRKLGANLARARQVAGGDWDHAALERR